MRTSACVRILILLLLASATASADILITSANANSIFRYDQNSGSFLQKFDNTSVQYPNGLALGPDGYLYTATSDAVNDFASHIDRYDPVTGKLLFSFGSLPQTRGMTIGPDGLIYVSAFNSNQIWRYNPTTAAFLDVFVSSVPGPSTMAFGPDGNLYVCSPSTDSVLKYSGTTGAFLSQFITEPGLSPQSFVFGPDGYVYVGSSSAYSNQVRRYIASTGVFDKIFATDASLAIGSSMAFGPDGNLYVGSSLTASVLRFHGTTGALIDTFITTGSGGLGTNLTGILFLDTARQWPVAQGGNGHWYELANSYRLWPDARTQAATKGGYLATLTSASENDWVKQNVLPGGPVTTSMWIGGADFALSGEWNWVEGPEAGQLFWKSGVGTITFSNWGVGEPNHCCAGPEFWLAINPVTGKWLDLFAAPEPYLVEFDHDPAQQQRATLIHHYTFQGDANDLVGSANGALLGGALATGGKLTLNGSGQYVQFGSHIVPTSGSYSVALFAQQSLPSIIAEFISQGFSGGPGFFLGYALAPVYAGDGLRATDSWLNTGVGFPSDGLQHHYALIVDSVTNQSRLYLDGVKRAVLPFAITTTPAGTHTRLGQQFDSFTEYFSGTLSDVRIYSGTLTDQEVTALVPPAAGTINITTNLAAATFTITGPATYGGGGTSFSQPNAPVGTYRVHYGDVPKYITPADQTGTVTAGQADLLVPKAFYTPITLSVCPASSPRCAQSMSFSFQQGVAGPVLPQQVLVTANGPSVGFTTSATSTPPGWLSVTVPPNQTTPVSLSVSVIPDKNLKAGTYFGQILVTSNAVTNSPVLLQITLTVTKGPPSSGFGSLLITSNVPNATFTITPNIPGSSGHYPMSLPNIPPGTYSITFDKKKGFEAPPTQQVLITTGETTYFSAKYKRLLVVLFTGFSNAPPGNGDQYPDHWHKDGIGMTTLADRILNYAPIADAAHASTFTFYYPGNGGGSCGIPACTPPRDNSDDPDPQAWLQAMNPGQEDRIVIIGHSYGGNRARLFAEQLRNLSYTVDALGLVDPIDWTFCSIANLGSHCDQSDLIEVQPDSVVLSKTYVQTTSDLLKGYHLYTDKFEYPFTETPYPFITIPIPDCLFHDTKCSHQEIDDQTSVQDGLLAMAQAALLAPRKTFSATSISDITSHSARIAWSSHETTIGEVLVATDSTLAQFYVAGHDFETNHSVVVNNLLPNTTYYFRLSAQEASAAAPVYSDILVFSTTP